MQSPEQPAAAIFANHPETLAATAGWRRVLVVMPGYMASPTSDGIGMGSWPLGAAGFVWRLTTRRPARDRIRVYRDFYANPRDAAYMATLLDELFREYCPAASAVLVAADETVAALRGARWLEHAIVVPSSGGEPGRQARQFEDALAKLASEGSFDAALIVHPDAIGLGQEPIERALVRHGPVSLFALSGRRRLRSLDARQRRRWRRRRFLAETQLVETWLARGLWIWASILALRDRMAGEGSEARRP